MAVVLVHAWRARSLVGRPRSLAVGAGVLAFIHLVLAPLLWPLMTVGFRKMVEQTEPVRQALEHELDYQRLPSSAWCSSRSGTG